MIRLEFLFIFSLLIQEGRASTHALLLEGGDTSANHYSRYYYNLQSAYEYYNQQHVPKENITVLSGPGYIDEAIYSTGNPNNKKVELDPPRPVVHGAAKKTELLQALKDQFMALESGDNFEIYITDHGYNDELDVANPSGLWSNTGINLWGEKLSNEEFYTLIREAYSFADPKGKKKINLKILGGQCFSGSIHQISGKFNQDPLGGLSVCSSSSTRSWLPSKLNDSGKANSDSYPVALYGQRPSLGKGSLFQISENAANLDSGNSGFGMTSSLAFMQKINRSGDNDLTSTSENSLMNADYLHNVAMNFATKSIAYNVFQDEDESVEKMSLIRQSTEQLSVSSEVLQNAALPCYRFFNLRWPAVETFAVDNLQIVSQLLFPFDKLSGLSVDQKSQFKMTCSQSLANMVELTRELIDSDQDLGKKISDMTKSMPRNLLEIPMTEDKHKLWIKLFRELSEISSPLKKYDYRKQFRELEFCLNFSQFSVNANADEWKAMDSLLQCEMSPM